MKKLALVVGIPVVAVILALVIALVAIDTIARVGVERGASYALDVETNLASADVEVLGGEFSMEQLGVANPEGFTNAHFLTLGQGGVAVTLGTLLKDVVELPHLRMNDLEVWLQKKEGKANYQVILDNLGRFESQEDKPSDQGGPPADAKRYIVREVTVEDVNVHVDLLPAGGELMKIDVPIERLTLEDVGAKDNRGIILAELVTVVVKAIMTTVVEQGGADLPADLVNDLKSQLAQLKDLGAVGATLTADVGEVVQQSGERIEEAAKGLEEAGKEAGRKAEEGIRNLLGGGDNNDGGDDGEDDDGGEGGSGG